MRPALVRRYLGFLCVMMMCTQVALAFEPKILNIYTWSEYLPAEVIQQFERETGIRINYSTYVNNEVLYAKLEGNPEAPYDIVMPSIYFVPRMQERGLFQALDYHQIPNIKHLNPVFLNQDYDQGNRYSLPYLWHSTGIVVNTRYHPAESVQAWADLWKPIYHDQLFILDDVREVFAMPLLIAGYSMNERNLEPIKDAYQTLKALMKNIRLFNEDAQQSIYIDEDITIGMGWSGNIYQARLENPYLQYIYPKEGFAISLDVIAIPKGARHPRNAHAFINFVCRPDIAKLISLSSGFSSPNLEAIKLMPAEMRDNPILYPSLEVMSRGVLLMDVGQSVSTYEKYYERLKLQ